MTSNVSEFVSELTKHILSGDKTNVLSVINKESFKETLKTNSLDLISIVCQLLTENKTERKTNFIECCESVISVVADNGFPEEVLLEMIEQADCADEEIFLALLLPMQRVLLRICEEKLSQSLQWVLNTIHRFLYSLPLPEDYKFQEEEQLLLENDETVIQITRVYSVVLDFYLPFVIETIGNKESSKNIKLKNILLQSFIHLLGTPVPGLDLTVHKSKSVFRYYVEKIVTWIVSMSDDILAYVMHVEQKNLSNFQIERNEYDHFVDADTPFFNFLFQNKFPNDAIGVFYYMVFYENIESDSLLCVYNPKFIFESCLYFSLVLIEISHSSAQFKGLFLAKSVVERLDDDSITCEALESPIHKRFFETLSKHAVYNEVEKIRKLSVKIITVCFKKYDCKSQYLLLFNLENSVTHAGLLGYLITFIKDIVVSMLNSPSDVSVKYFSGKSLFDIMKKYFRLPDGVESDLVDIADKLISSLNLIRFLVIRDIQNISGIWDYMDEIEKLLFTPLYEELKLSRSHYELRLREIKDKVDSKSNKDANKDNFMKVTVGKEELSPLAKEEQISVIYLGLTALDLIQSILGRINECISLRNNQ